MKTKTSTKSKTAKAVLDPVDHFNNDHGFFFDISQEVVPGVCSMNSVNDLPTNEAIENMIEDAVVAYNDYVADNSDDYRPATAAQVKRAAESELASALVSACEPEGHSGLIVANSQQSKLVEILTEESDWVKVGTYAGSDGTVTVLIYNLTKSRR